MGDQSLWDSLLSWLRDSHGMRIDEETLQVECRDALGKNVHLNIHLDDCMHLILQEPARDFLLPVQYP